MKSKFLFFLVVIIASCDPKGELYNPTATITIRAQVVNPKSEINLGDSVAFYFEVPDTVDVNGSRITVAATGKDDGAELGFHISKINPGASAGVELNPSSCPVYASPGRLSPSKVLVFANEAGKLKAKYYLVPQQKGVYLLEQTQEGYAWLNNKGLSTRTSINFGSVNRNHQMLIDSATGIGGFSTWLQDRVSRGMEIYGFRVK